MKYLGYFKTRQEAMKALADYNENPFDLASREITFAELYERWCKIKYKDKPVLRIYTAAYKKLEPLHNMKFSEIRKRHIQGVIDGCETGWQSKSHMKSLCGQMFKFAIDQEVVTTNYAALVELPNKSQSEIHKPFTHEEIQILWQNTDSFGVRIALILCYTGLRPSELLEIKTADVNLEEKFMRGGMKTSAGKNRVIPIADKILPFISGMYNSANEYLVTKNGKPMYYEIFRHTVWKNDKILQSLPTKHLPHDDITNRIYTHKTIQQLIDAINRI